MSGDNSSPSEDDHRTVNRRTVLGTLAGAGVASLAGCSLLQAEEDAPTTALDDETARDLAVAFAPTLYFDEEERWFPTDPRPYESDADGDTVVDGFDSFDGYTGRYEDAEAPPDPTVFYHVVQYEDSPLAVVQYWCYSAFDQFTTNFHWHDWEVLHVFVDVGGADSSNTQLSSDGSSVGNPQLYVASSHSRKVPNNEFLDPEREMVPRILSELGSHSSALSLNDERDAFQRLPIGDTLADITNSAMEAVETLAEMPVAYGLPRDEGSRLPYVVPELDGAPLYDHDRLPSVEQSDLVGDDLTVRSFDDLTSPPTDLPERETGLVFQHAERSEEEGEEADVEGEEADVEYELVPTDDLEHIDSFTGPQLSFEFAVPDFAEDAVAGHITTTGEPWNQPRYDNPATDISDPNHRQTLADRYDAVGEAAPVHSVVATVTEAVTSDDAPEDEGLTTEATTVEAVAMLESDPEAVPTFDGVAVVHDVPEGDHSLTVNGAGVAPHREAVSVTTDGGPTVAGVDGEIPLVARENATKLEVDTHGTDRDLSNLAVEDDFAGRLYDAPLTGPDAVYVHRGGAYTTEVRDADDEVGAFRVNPADEAAVRIDEPRTGKAPLATFLADVAEETRAEVAGAADDDDDDESDGRGGGSENAVRGLSQALAAVAEAARRAAERAESDDRGGADRSLETVQTRLQRVADRLAEARDDLPDATSRAAERRLEQAHRRSEQARAAEKL